MGRPSDAARPDDTRERDMSTEKRPGSAVIARLFETIESRRTADPAESHVASLFKAGTAEIAKKMGEEALETTIAALGGEREKITHESADLLFHLMVLWADAGLTPDDIYAELARREGVSGIAEKKSRA
jgi:phosphoribosyl-ATP pyrophosphohydrolase